MTYDVIDLARRAPLLNVDDVSAYLGVSVRTIWTLRAEGLFAPGTKIGKRVLWREEVLLNWLDSMTEAPGDSAVYKMRSAG